MRLLTILPWYISKSNSRSCIIKNLVKTYQHILSYFFLFHLFLLVSIALTINNHISVLFFHIWVGRINPGTFSVALTSRCLGHLWSSMPWSSSIAYSLSASPSSSLTIGLSKSPFQNSQLSVSQIHSGALSTLLAAGWWSILYIRHTYNTWVLLPGRSFTDKAGWNSDLSDNLNAAAPSCWMFDQDALTISSVSKMYPIAVICLFKVGDSICAARRFWLHCHFSKNSWTLAIVCRFLSSSSLFISMWFSDFVVSNVGSSHARYPLLAWGNWLTMTLSWRVSPVVLDCLHLITSRPSGKLASTLTPCCMIENILRATIERLAYFECISTCWWHQSVISSIHYTLLVTMGSEW